MIPFNHSNYLYGLTGVKFWTYVLASWIGMMPGTFLYVYIGAAGKAAVSATAGSEAVKHGWQYWTLMSVGLAATVHCDNLGRKNCAQCLSKNCRPEVIVPLKLLFGSGGFFVLKRQAIDLSPLREGRL